MSYILEALKKSSEERARLAGGEIRQAQPATIASPERREASSSGWLIAGAGLLVLAGVAAYVVLNERGPESAANRPLVVAENPAPAAVPVTPQPEPAMPSTPVPQTAPVMQPIPVPTVRTVQPEVRAEMQPGNAVVSRNATVQPPPAPPVSPRVQAYEAELKAAQKSSPVPAEKPPVSSVPVPAAPAQPSAVVPQPVPAQAVSPATEMPPELLRQVQAIPIAAHVYSSRPADRMVVIEGRAAREGDVTASGMAIEQITPTGIVVTYKGYRANRTVH